MYYTIGMKTAKRTSLVKKMAIGITALTLFFVIALGTIIYIRVQNLNNAQFSEKINQSLTLMDVTMRNHFESISTSVELFSDIDLIKEDNDNIKSYVNLTSSSGKIAMTPLENGDYEASVYRLSRAFVNNKKELLGVSLALESNGAFTRYPEVARTNNYDSRTRSWYTDAVKANGKVHFSKAYTTSAGETVIVASRLIKTDSGKVRGVVTADADLSNLQELFRSISGNDNTKTSVILCDEDGSILVDTIHPENLFKNIKETGIKGLAAFESGKELTFREWLNGYGFEVQVIPSKNGIIPLNYIVIVPDVESKKSNQAIIKSMLLLLAIAIAVSLITSHLFGRTVAKPLIKVTAILKNISEGDGDLTQRLPKLSKDEIGDLAEHFNAVMEKLSASISSVKGESEIMRNIGENLADNVNATAGATTEISSNIESMRYQVQSQSAGVEETTATMRSIVDGISRLNTDIDSQSASVENSSSAIDQLVTNIRNVTTILEENSKNMDNLTNSAEEGRTLIAKTVDLTQKISEDSKGLMDASKIIQNLASQTNLLAMNAAIEAAHAGETGKGFAVVSDEIRKLAEDSSAQGKHISDVLSKLGQLIATVVKSAESIQKQFAIIFTNTQAVSTQEAEIKSAMEEQSEGSQQVLDAMKQINSLTTHVKTESAAMKEGSKQILDEMSRLAELTSEINSGMNEMTTGVVEINNTMQEINQKSSDTSQSISKVAEVLATFRV